LVCRDSRVDVDNVYNVSDETDFDLRLTNEIFSLNNFDISQNYQCLVKCLIFILYSMFNKTDVKILMQAHF